MALKIRTWSLIGAASALLPLIALFIFALTYIDAKERAFVEADLKYRTSELAQIANERLAVTVQVLHLLSQSPSVHTGDWLSLYKQARQITQSNPDYLAVALTDDRGELLFVTQLPYGERTFPPDYPNLAHHVLTSGKPHVSGPFKSTITPGHLVVVSVPLMRDHRITNVLQMMLSTDTLDSILHQDPPPEGWLVALADKEGLLLARSPSGSAYVGNPASLSMAAAIQRKDGQIYRGFSLEGEAITAMVYPVFRGDWYAAIAVPDRILDHQSRRTILLMLVLSIGAALLGFGAAFVGAQLISRQAKTLEGAVGSLSTNGALPAPPVGITEFADLYQSFCDIIASEQKIGHYLRQVTSEKNEIHDLYEHAPCGYHSLDTHGCIIRINQTALDWLGRTREEVLGQPFKKFITEKGQRTFDQHFPEFLANGHVDNLEFVLICADGSTRPVTVNATLIRDKDGKPLMSRSIVFDITQRKQLEQRLEELSYIDFMTGLSNRRYFNELATREIERAIRLHSPFVLGILDVDHFKRVNDEFGHSVGDRLLTALGKVLKSELRSIDIPARIGGEEFALLLPHTDLDHAKPVLERLREALAAISVPSNDGRTVTFTVSIGFTIQQAGETDLDAILSRAGNALYKAKRGGRNQICAG